MQSLYMDLSVCITDLDELQSTELLPFQGYFEAEFRRMKAARERWETLTEERKEEIRKRMRNVRSMKP